jgi:glycosyltransferase involved in cell wall biosynthesis
MKILFISDFGLHHNKGGAQRSNQMIIDEGIARNHQVIPHHIDSSSVDLMYSYDLVISSNLEAFSKHKPEVFNFLSKQKKHIRLEHDMCAYLSEDDRNHLFDSTILNIFLSEFHIKCFKTVYGLSFSNATVVYDPIDTSLFNNQKKERSSNVLYCGFLHPLKGYPELVSYAKFNPSINVDIYGWGDPRIIHDIKSKSNMEYLGSKEYEDMPEIYNSYERIFHKPQVNEPFCRMVAEAMLCGMKPIHNNKIGSIREVAKVGLEEFAQKANNAAKEFWEKVEQCIE